MLSKHDVYLPYDHEEFLGFYPRTDERQKKMSREQHEEPFLRGHERRMEDPEFEMHLAACYLAAVGELGAAGSRLGDDRAQALKFLRRRLTRDHIAEIERILFHYDVSVPHPPHVFGPGWTEADRLRAVARTNALDERAGIPTEAQWFAKRHQHWYFRLIDALPSRCRVLHAVSLARRWRWVRHAI
jgi:hypothetical protein